MPEQGGDLGSKRVWIQRHDHVRLTAELIVVFFGVTAAFGLERWSQERNDRAVEQRYLESLHVEIVQDSVALREMVDALRARVEGARTLLDDIEAGIVADTVGEAALTVLASQLYIKPNRATWNALIGSGNLDLIGLHELKMRLSSLYSYYGGLEEAGQMLMDYSFRTTIPMLQETIDLRDTSIIDPDLLSKPRFFNVANFHYFITLGYAQMLEAALDECRMTLELLDAELAGDALEEEAS